jgi:hypothetical protein
MFPLFLLVADELKTFLTPSSFYMKTPQKINSKEFIKLEANVIKRLSIHVNNIKIKIGSALRFLYPVR